MIQAPFVIEKLFVNTKETAAMLGHSVSWFNANVEDLEKHTGFPKIDPVVGKRHREAIEIWARQRNLKQLPKNAEQNDSNSENFDGF